MAKYEVYLYGTKTSCVEVEAETFDEASQKALDMANDEEVFILDTCESGWKVDDIVEVA